MSTGVSDQRMKGQGNQANGPKDHLNEQEDFEAWRSTQLHQGYPHQISTTLSSDPYTMSNYYNTPFSGYPTAFGVAAEATSAPPPAAAATWSTNGGADPMGTFLAADYHHPLPHSYEGVFGAGGAPPSAPFSAFGGGQAGANASAAGNAFNYFHSTENYSTWGSMTRKPAAYDDYYRSTTSTSDYELKTIEHGMHQMGIDSAKTALPEAMQMKEQRQPKTWATVASQPAKPQPTPGTGGVKKKGPGMPPPPMVPGKHLDISTWETRNGGVVKAQPPMIAPPPPPVQVPAAAPIPNPAQMVRPAAAWSAPNMPPPPMAASNRGNMPLMHPHHPLPHPPQHQPQSQPQPIHLPAATTVGNVTPSPISHPILEELRVKNNYNPDGELSLDTKGARFFVIKSYSEDDIHRSIKYEIWCSTEHGNKRLDQAFREADSAPIYLFFSVNGSGHFCGMAQMVTPVDYSSSSSVWSQDKWKGQFRVRWVYVKDVPNSTLRHIKLENNENKPVTNSRDTQEVPFEKGLEVLRIVHNYQHKTSIFDDFIHYEKRQEEEDFRRAPPPSANQSSGNQQQQQHHQHNARHHHQQQQQDAGEQHERRERAEGSRHQRGNRNRH